MSTRDRLFDLTGRVALITGSTQGLGEATARVMAQHGAHVIISSRKQDACERVAASIRDNGMEAEGIACNIGHEDQIAGIFSQIEDRHGRLDILVNNAVLSPWRTIEDTDRALLMKALETNIAGYWFMSAEAVKLMKRQGRGSIINISSIAAIRPTVMLALYSTFKASIDGMTKSFAVEFGRDGIRVNTILPGLFDTSLADAFTPEFKRETEQKTPLGRLGKPEEIGNAALFLASDASSYVTGTSLIVDGGRVLAG
jgi:NAD(P)-dependent dehydrogenase (short-subunit alcohol dehydrogenase family)